MGKGTPSAVSSLRIVGGGSWNTDCELVQGFVSEHTAVKKNANAEQKLFCD